MKSVLQYGVYISYLQAKAPSEPVDVDSDSDEDEDVDVTANLSDLSLTDLDVLISGDEAVSTIFDIIFFIINILILLVSTDVTTFKFILIYFKNLSLLSTSFIFEIC